jgi:hypothetical protein
MPNEPERTRANSETKEDHEPKISRDRVAWRQCKGAPMPPSNTYDTPLNPRSRAYKAGRTPPGEVTVGGTNGPSDGIAIAPLAHMGRCRGRFVLLVGHRAVVGVSSRSAPHPPPYLLSPPRSRDGL